MPESDVQKFRAIVDVYVEGTDCPVKEPEVASLIERTLPYGRSLRVVIIPQQVEEDRNYSGEMPPETSDFAGRRSHG